MSNIATNLNEILTDIIEDYEETSLTLAELLEEIDTYIDSISDNDKHTASIVLQGMVSSIIENIIGGESEEEEDGE